jgi:hypothetical protein
MCAARQIVAPKARKGFEIRCGNCAHFHYDTSTCRRLPPVHGALDSFPRVVVGIWCGEFYPKCEQSVS